MVGSDAWNISEPTNYWRPVFSISLALDYSLWGLNPLGFHLTNVLLHTINTVLLFSLGRKLQNTTCAVFASLLFAFHPIQAHAVNFISTRGELLAAFFTLLSLLAFLSGRTIPFAIAMALALLSKETSMIFPLAILFVGTIVEKSKQDSRLILAFVILGLYLVIRLSLGFSFSLIPLIFSYQAPWDTRFLLAFKVLALYFLAIFNLFEMPHPFWTVEMPTSVNDPYVISGVLILLFLLGAIWRAWKKEPIVAFGLAWFLIYFLPISNLKQLNQPMAEHWLYLPMIGLCLAIGALSNVSFIRRREVRLVRVGIIAAFAVFLIFAALVLREKAKIYQDDESFWLAAIRANPQVAGLYSILGSTYLVRQDIPRAKEFYIKTLTLDPNDFSANYMLGSLLYRAGQLDEAKIYLERITRVKPALKLEFAPVAHAWEMLGDKQNALFYYRRALDIDPDSIEIKQKVASLENQMRPQMNPSVPRR
jgi:tetratricopeptide (TPR) repeat protein